MGGLVVIDGIAEFQKYYYSTFPSSCFVLVIFYSFPGLEIAFLDPYGTGTVWPVLFSPSRSLLALRAVEDILMTLVLFGERDCIQINVS